MLSFEKADCKFLIKEHIIAIAIILMHKVKEVFTSLKRKAIIEFIIVLKDILPSPFST
jgi:hypothetical protein